MTENPLDSRRKRIFMRANHRGMKEMDIILGRFVDDYLAQLPEADLETLEHFMEIDDQSLYAIITGRIETAPQYTDLVEKIRKVNSL